MIKEKSLNKEYLGIALGFEAYTFSGPFFDYSSMSERHDEVRVLNPSRYNE
jgi:hypothetical protein